MTYYLDVQPAGMPSPPVHEAVVEADSRLQAIMSAREIPGVLLVTRVRDWSKPSRACWPTAGC